MSDLSDTQKMMIGMMQTGPVSTLLFNDAQDDYWHLCIDVLNSLVEKNIALRDISGPEVMYRLR